MVHHVSPPAGGASAARSVNHSADHPARRQQALDLHRAGRLTEAAALYETLLAVDAADAGVHGNLAAIRFLQGRLVEALRHVHRAAELSRWADAAIGANFAHIVRNALENLDQRRQALRWRQYLDWLAARRAAVPAGPVPSSISLLLPVPPAAGDLARLLRSFADWPVPPAEVLLGGLGSSPGSLLSPPPGLPFPVRHLAVADTSLPRRLNGLAEQAVGDWLLALAPDDSVDGAGLARLAAAVPAGGWGLLGQVADEPYRTVGHALLDGAARPRLAQLLVSRQLHARMGGHGASGDGFLTDYCLRLLWEAEPVCLPLVPGPSSPPGQATDPAAVAAYLAKAATGTAAPNGFAPGSMQWGLSHYAFAMAGGFPLPLPALRRLVADLDAYLLAAERRPIHPRPGVNLVGPALTEFGLGEIMRAFAGAATDMPHRVVDVAIGAARRGDLSLVRHLGEGDEHACSIYFFNPDQVQLYRQSLDRLVFERAAPGFPHRRIGYWFWELERFPEPWRYALDRVDEIWVASDFVARAVAAVTDKPVLKMPPPLLATVRGSYQRARFGLPDGRFLFLFSFSFASYPQRKNPVATVRAFRRAFADRRAPVGLVLKSTHGAGWPEALAELRREIGDDPRIVLMDRFLDRDEVLGLQSVCDCHVSLHRAEGLGLGLAEAMAMGKPAIATAYSGNLEFMNEDNSALVRHALVPVPPGDYYLCDAPGYQWAEPDVDHAAELMARVAEDRVYRERIADRGRQDILVRHGLATAAARMGERLRQLGAL